jgi:toxin ParE1/3/4
MSMVLRLSHLAVADLNEIYGYTFARWGEEQAERYLALLWDAMESLPDNPDRWRLRNHVHPGCRICLAGKHAILYRVRDGNVEVARVLHGMMDFPRHVPKNFMSEE